jgi:nicotinate-nucleotide pyrophosphorylase (carboxylating)
MFDNFSLDEMRAGVALRHELGADGVVLEASGGLTLEDARRVGETGVDYIAVGELTHSVRVLDLGLDLTPER